jgi:hypothetical protein
MILVSCLAYSSALKMEAASSSETSVDFQRTTWRYILEDRTPHQSYCLHPRVVAVLLNRKTQQKLIEYRKHAFPGFQRGSFIKVKAFCHAGWFSYYTIIYYGL